MLLVLTNYGHRLVERYLKTAHATAAVDEDLAILSATLSSLAIPDDGSSRQARLVERGWLARHSGPLDHAALKLRYLRNPLEHVQRVTFEITTLCQLDCGHCRNGSLAPSTGGHTDKLCEVVDLMVPLGVHRFDFVGGEVTLFGHGWLEIVKRIREHPTTTAAVLTSGWFLGERDFLAANRRYRDADAYLRALAEAGLTHVVFSLDGPPEEHDRCRGVPGLYDRIIAGFEQVRAAGMRPQVSIVHGPWVHQSKVAPWLLDVAVRLYGGQPSGLDDMRQIQRLLDDDMNYASHFIDVGNGAQRALAGAIHLDQLDERLLRCKNFFRPYPTLRILADGELALCPLLAAATGYGNVHRRPLVEVLNGIQDATAFRLHADARIASYLPLLDRSIFGSTFTHICTLRVVLTLLARGIEDDGIDSSDPEALRALNVKVARQAGFMPRQEPRALGIRRPR